MSKRENVVEQFFGVLFAFKKGRQVDFFEKQTSSFQTFEQGQTFKWLELI